MSRTLGFHILYSMPASTSTLHICIYTCDSCSTFDFIYVVFSRTSHSLNIFSPPTPSRREQCVHTKGFFHRWIFHTNCSRYLKESWIEFLGERERRRRRKYISERKSMDVLIHCKKMYTTQKVLSIAKNSEEFFSTRSVCAYPVRELPISIINDSRSNGNEKGGKNTIYECFRCCFFSADFNHFFFSPKFILLLHDIKRASEQWLLTGEEGEWAWFKKYRQRALLYAYMLENEFWSSSQNHSMDSRCRLLLLKLICYVKFSLFNYTLRWFFAYFFFLFLPGTIFHLLSIFGRWNSSIRQCGGN